MLSGNVVSETFHEYFLTVQKRLTAYCGSRVAAKLLMFLMTPYSLIQTLKNELHFFADWQQ
jgi:hypothetical protein